MDILNLQKNACSIIGLSRFVIGMHPWPSEYIKYTNYSFVDVYVNLLYIHQIFLEQNTILTNSFIKKKYISKKYYEVVKIKIPNILHDIFSLCI